MAQRVLVACLWHESHGFVAGLTALPEFTHRRGSEMLACRGDRSTLDGVLAGAERLGLHAVPTIDIHAPPSAPAEDAVLDAFLRSVREDVAAAESIDGVLLVLHGAMMSAGQPDIEGAVVSALRRMPRLADLPIVGVFDLHGNISRAMCDQLDAVVVFRRNPHDDAHAAGLRAAAVLARLLASGRRGRCVHVQPGVVWTPIATGTSDTPMSLLEAAARAIEERDPDVLEAAVFAGFAYADHPDVGVSLCVSTIGEVRIADGYARNLAESAWEHRRAGDRRDDPPDVVLANIRTAPPGPVVVAEPSDNIGGGTRGDGTGLLRLLLDHDVGGDCLVAICDPAAVATCAQHQLGARLTLAIGGRGYAGDPGPVERDWVYVSRSSGRFVLEEPASPLAALFGQTVEMGPCAVVRCGRVSVLLTSRPTPPWDLGQWRSQGLAPERARVIAVKAAIAHRLAYAAIAGSWMSVATPGPCPTDVSAIPYRTSGAQETVRKQLKNSP